MSTGVIHLCLDRRIRAVAQKPGLVLIFTLVIFCLRAIGNQDVQKSRRRREILPREVILVAYNLIENCL